MKVIYAIFDVSFCGIYAYIPVVLGEVSLITFQM